MDIRQEIESELWAMIKKNYENGNYSGAILDAVYTLTDLVRNKTGLEGDGASLVGQAFGGDNPRIQINKLQTDSEKDAQKGIQEIIKGLYTGIRNPRSHDKISDKQQDADSIIVLVNYLIRVIGKSNTSFEESTYLQRVFDYYFVRTKQYAALLVEEIPKRQRCNIAISIIRRKSEGERKSLSIFLEVLFAKLDEIEIARVYNVISDELKFTTLEDDIAAILQICPAQYWRKIEKSVKMRIENILLDDAWLGTYDSVTGEFGGKGSLGNLVTLDYLKQFDNLDLWTSILVEKFDGKDSLSSDYAKEVFWSKICSINYNNINIIFKLYIESALKCGYMPTVNRFADIIKHDENHPWWKVFAKELKLYPEIIYEEDDLPF